MYNPSVYRVCPVARGQSTPARTTVVRLVGRVERNAAPRLGALQARQSPCRRQDRCWRARFGSDRRRTKRGATAFCFELLPCARDARQGASSHGVRVLTPALNVRSLLTVNPLMPCSTRVAFTLQDKDDLAEFLAKVPEQKRTSRTIYAEFAATVSLVSPGLSTFPSGCRRVASAVPEHD